MLPSLSRLTHLDILDHRLDADAAGPLSAALPALTALQELYANSANWGVAGLSMMLGSLVSLTCLEAAVLCKDSASFRSGDMRLLLPTLQRLTALKTLKTLMLSSGMDMASKEDRAAVLAALPSLEVLRY